MNDAADRRTEKRLRYQWPIWFAEDFSGLLTQGQMVDVSSGGAAFTCHADKCPSPGQQITARFSVPLYDQEETFDLSNFIRTGRICRVEQVNPFLRRVAIQFSDKLPLKPGEQIQLEEHAEPLPA